MGQRLVDAYDLIIFDLDGVVYLVDQPIPGAVPAIARLREERRAVAYATNNASRRAVEVAELLSGMGVPASADEVLTSAGAAAAVLADQLPAGAPGLVVGAEALRAEVTAVGLTVVASGDDGPAAVVQGYGPGVGWADLAEASVAIRAGASWVATNTDRTLPTGRGPLPGNGSLVAALATALERQPDTVVGKPQPGLFATAARQAGARSALVVGDRLDTDIEGAVRAGMDSLLVLTGVSQAADVLAADPTRRPTHLAADLAGLFADEAEVRVPAAPVAGGPDGGWRVAVDGGTLTLSGAGDPPAALRALCPYAWAGDAPVVVAGSADAAAALKALGLPG
ncbi:MAG TPA: HAD-IIA family hydrolase [Pilimelia sp.]|nr:HAD-IIA family hydrolase [Pilimelia sp.]